MKLFIISLDMLVALPILSVAAIFLFSGIRGSQSYLLALGGSESARLNALTASQQIAQAMDSASNYSSALQIAGNMSARYALAARVSNQGDVQECGDPGAVCRLVTVSGSAYLLVVSYENAG